MTDGVLKRHGWLSAKRSQDVELVRVLNQGGLLPFTDESVKLYKQAVWGQRKAITSTVVPWRSRGFDVPTDVEAVVAAIARKCELAVFWVETLFSGNDLYSRFLVVEMPGGGCPFYLAVWREG